MSNAAVTTPNDCIAAHRVTTVNNHYKSCIHSMNCYFSQCSSNTTITIVPQYAG
jgi:hypothetical protein